MYLKMDGNVVLAKPEQTLLDLLRQAGMEKTTLPDRPLAAKIAGEVGCIQNYQLVIKTS